MIFFQSNFFFFSLLKTCFLTFLMMASTQGESQGASVHPALIVDKLSVRFVGVPATSAQKNSYLNREKSLSQIAEEMKNDPRFERKLSQYWLQAFKIRSAVDLGAIIDPAADSGRGQTLNQYLFQKSGSRDIVYMGTEEGGKRCARYVMVGEFTLDRCNCDQAVDIKPWWNPSVAVKACPNLDAPSVCGANLQSCFPRFVLHADPSNFYSADLLEGFTLEPGRIAAKTIIEDRSWDEVVRGTQSVMNGAMQHFISTYGDLLLKVYPPRSFVKKDAANQLNLPGPSHLNRKYQWVERGDLHAGILTTIAFQTSFNGWRAKANAAMESFLCQKFKIPKDAVQVPSEEKDLTLRPYCQSCHTTLEPLSHFFGRWPNLASTNYYYNSAPNVSAVGSFGGVSDSDTVGLGRVFSARPEFNECAVERAFEFVIGRGMQQHERIALLPSLTGEFTKNGKKLWPVIKVLIDNPLFRGEAP